MSAFRLPSSMGTEATSPSLAGIGYDPTSLESLKSYGLPTFGASPGNSNSLADNWFGENGKMGNLNTALNVGKGLFGMWAGIKGMNMAKDQFNQQKMLSNENLRMSKLNYNMRLQAGQENKLAAMGQTAAANQGILSVADQLKKYGA